MGGSQGRIAWPICLGLRTDESDDHIGHQENCRNQARRRQISLMAMKLPFRKTPASTHQYPMSHMHRINESHISLR